MPVSAASAVDVLDILTGRAAVNGSTPFTGYLAACTAAPVGTTTAALLANEVTTAGYARQAPSWSAVALDGAGTASEPNSVAVTYGPFTADPPAITDLVLVDTSSGTGGKVRYVFHLTAPVDAGNGDSIQIPVGALKLTVPYQT
jgi:hypothetical protein